MTNPTSNFGWQMPTSTDLVTDLPADFEIFGQAVDTSLADLKGGTTNQVLAKNSNTDMDFKWVADASGIPTSSFAAKGDLLVGTGSGTYVAQTVGANGTVLTANSAQADGVEWVAPTAGGYTLLSTNTVTGGVSSYSVSSIAGGYKHLHIFFKGVSTSADNTEINLRFNSIASLNYSFGGFWGSSYADNDTTSIYSFGVGTTSSTVRHQLHGDLFVPNYTTTGVVQANIRTFTRTNSGFNRWTDINANFTNAAAISSITILPVTGTLSGGTILVYGVN